MQLKLDGNFDERQQHKSAANSFCFRNISVTEKTADEYLEFQKRKEIAKKKNRFLIS